MRAARRQALKTKTMEAAYSMMSPVGACLLCFALLLKLRSSGAGCQAAGCTIGRLW